MIERLLSGVVIILLIPLFSTIIMGYLLAGHTNILFSQMRIGFNQKPFRLFKFKTLENSESVNPQQRKFGLGTFLRRSSLDELPQLFNIILGEMSFVGPRPLPIEYQTLFSDEQRIRFQVRPGITGLAQINGGTKLSWSEKFSYDLTYVQNHSFWADISILLKTVGVIMSKKEDGLQEEPFKGN